MVGFSYEGWLRLSTPKTVGMFDVDDNDGGDDDDDHDASMFVKIRLPAAVGFKRCSTELGL